MEKLLTRLIAFCLTHRLVVFAMVGAIAIFGVVSFNKLPIEAFPDVTNTNVIIITQWPGRSAQEVERFISIPMELELNVVPKKTYLRSVSLFGLSVVTIIFDDGVLDFEARTEVMQRIQNVDLPDGAEQEVEPPSGPTGEIFRYTLSSKTEDPTQLKTIQDWVIEKELKTMPGIADIVSFGGRVRTFEVSLDPTLLGRFGFTALDVSDALKKANINVAGNVINYGEEAFVVRGIGLLKDVNDIGNVVVASVSGVPVKLFQVATVRESYKPRLGIVGRDSLDDEIEGIVLMRKGEDPGKVLPAVKAKIDSLNKQVLPKGVKIDTFYDRTDLNHSTLSTVRENVITGIILVTIILFVFLMDWRTTLAVAVVIPLALLFAFILMDLKGMRANLLSLGAIDFGIIIDGAVVMIEGIFVVLALRAHELGQEKFNKHGKLSWISHTAAHLGKSIFTSKLIIITALLPIFSFQKVEGKLFSPLAFTMGFALLGALIISLTLVPLLAYMLLKKDIKEKDNIIVKKMERAYEPALTKVLKFPKTILLISSLMLATAIAIFYFFIGSEFLPHLDEGSIYVRATMPMSVSLEDSYHYSRKFRAILARFPEVRKVLSQTGRPNDGTDPTGFFNIEFFVDLYPEDDWESEISKEDLITQMERRLDGFPGITFNFSQPITDNVEEAVAGVKGSIAIKIFGTDLNKLEDLADKTFAVMKKVKGVEDLGILRNLGQPELRITLDQRKLAQYNVSTEDCQDVIEMAIGGKSINQVYEEEKRFDIMVRYDEPFRYSEDAISNLIVPTVEGKKIPLKQLADIHTYSGPAFVYREDNKRFIAIKFSVRGRDLGSTIKDAQKQVQKSVKMPGGYNMLWKGEFENQQRALKRLTIVVPISILLIFLILYISFGNTLDAGIILMNVPFSLIGGILALLVTGIHFSISAGVGFIALFGVSIQAGVILVNTFKQKLDEGVELHEAVREGALSRLRPVVMTALMDVLGLLPAAISTGIGSETQKPLAVVMIGGLISSTILDMLNVPAIVSLMYSRRKKKIAQHRNE